MADLGIGDQILNGFKSFAGNIPKAMLIVRNPENVKPLVYDNYKDKSPEDKTADDKQRAATAQAAIGELKKMQESMINKYNSNKGEAVRFDDAKSVRDAAYGKNKDYVVIEVQYNPSKLRLDTSAGMRTSMKDNELQTMDYPAATTLNVQLIFDDMNVHDAFMLSNLAPSIGNIYNGVKDIMGGDGNGSVDENGKSDKNFSVQVQMDGIMSLLQRVETRYLMFAWSGMFFYGELVSVSLRYTMFNKKGCPVRGTADLQIRQAIETDNNKKVIDYWDKAYQTFFEDYDTTKGGFSPVNNNILNINL